MSCVHCLPSHAHVSCRNEVGPPPPCMINWLDDVSNAIGAPSRGLGALVWELGVQVDPSQIHVSLRYPILSLNPPNRMICPVVTSLANPACARLDGELVGCNCFHVLLVHTQFSMSPCCEKPTRTTSFKLGSKAKFPSNCGPVAETCAQVEPFHCHVSEYTEACVAPGP